MDLRQRITVRIAALHQAAADAQQMIGASCAAGDTAAVLQWGINRLQTQTAIGELMELVAADERSGSEQPREASVGAGLKPAPTGEDGSERTVAQTGGDHGIIEFAEAKSARQG